MEEFWIFLEEKRVLWPFGGTLSLLEAFCMVLWVFDGNMVGKWTNEPCNGVDEVVNPFWVITGFAHIFRISIKISLDCMIPRLKKTSMELASL